MYSYKGKLSDIMMINKEAYDMLSKSAADLVYNNDLETMIQGQQTLYFQLKFHEGLYTAALDYEEMAWKNKEELVHLVVKRWMEDKRKQRGERLVQKEITNALA